MNRPIIFLAVLMIAGTPIVALAAQPCPFSWNTTLAVGSRGVDVLRLQQFLNTTDTTTIAISGSGSPGQESEYFGAKTARAVAAFQEKHGAELLTPAGLSSGTGIVGPRTRAKLNALCSASVHEFAAHSTSTVRATPEATLTISRSEQPAQSIAPAGAGGVPFTSLTLTAGVADVVVTAITVERVGAGSDGAFEEIEIADEQGEIVGDARVLNAQHRAIFSEQFTIRAGEAKTLTVYGSMAEDLAEFDGQIPILRIVGIEASAPVRGSLPIDGTPQTVNASLAIGEASAMRSSFDPELDRTLYINEQGVRFSGIRITAGTREDLELEGIEWEQAGSAGPDDIARVETVVDGTAYPTEQIGRVYASTFDPAIKIPRGTTRDVHIRGDILPGAANRTIKFDLYESGAISLTGLQYGFGVGIAASSHTGESGNSIFRTSDGTTDGDELNPFYSGSVISVMSGGFISIGRN